ncbi:glycolipid transfer protein domain-containing protein [Scleroderma yunnanense]
MAPFLETVKSFADVGVTEDGVDTLAFLEAAEGVVKLFKLLENPAFVPVVNDLEGNITKVRTRYNTHSAQSATLELLLINERSEKKRPATEGLMWLLRGLAFTYKALHVAQADAKVELSNAFTLGYEATLKQYHNFVVKGIFALAMKACPYRKAFYEKLAADPSGRSAVSPEKLDVELNQWLAGLERILQRMKKVYEEKKYGEV